MRPIIEGDFLSNSGKLPPQLQIGLSFKYLKSEMQVFHVEHFGNLYSRVFHVEHWQRIKASPSGLPLESAVQLRLRVGERSRQIPPRQTHLTSKNQLPLSSKLASLTA